MRKRKKVKKRMKERKKCRFVGVWNLVCCIDW